MPETMKQKLDAARNQRLAKAGPAGTGPSLVPKKLQKEVAKEPPPPNIEDIIRAGNVDGDEADTLIRLLNHHASIGQQERALEAEKKPITDRIKVLIKDNVHLHKLIAGEAQLEFYPVTRGTIKAERLLELGIAPATIAAATSESTAWTLKIRGLKELEK